MLLNDQVEPYDGARQLWRLARKVPAAEPSLTRFIHLASEWEGVPDCFAPFSEGGHVSAVLGGPVVSTNDSS